jgi:hypothetical protein
MKRLASGAGPLAISLFRGLVRWIGTHSENLDQHMVAAQAERCGLGRHFRDGALEFVRGNRATRGDSRRYRCDEGGDAANVEHRQPAGLHQDPLPVDEEGVL